MNLLVTFIIIVFVTIGVLVGLTIGIERMTSPFISLFAFFPLLFLGVYIAWKLSVKITEPKVGR
jgi:hypothetical protein